MSTEDLPRAQGLVRFGPERHEELHDQTVRRITAKIDPEDPLPIWWEMVVMGDTLGLHITVNPDTDELIVKLTEISEPGGGEWTDVTVLADCIGGKIGWWWCSINSQGSWDMFTLAFAEWAVPSVAFFGIASEVQVMRMEIISP
ncbi:DUF6334 family protein [Caulobacter sp. B11]|uniref:DUF6334 family protein n=1 Tax=Caulobacter sp. B11 TaxID=2048899 RepID=UPI00117DD759|nr:DUF6334 family protein [Caulobacter sp. B11]